MNTQTHIDRSFHLAELAHGQRDAGHIHHDPNHLEFNGIAIPEEVIRQLKMLTGESVHMMSSHELDKAVMNFKGNGQVIRDEDGVHLHDMMHKHWGEDEKTTIWSHQNDVNHPAIFSHQHDDEIELHADDDDAPPFGFASRLMQDTTHALAI